MSPLVIVIPAAIALIVIIIREVRVWHTVHYSHISEDDARKNSAPVTAVRILRAEKDE
jgi:hypothetical protein